MTNEAKSTAFSFSPLFLSPPWSLQMLLLYPNMHVSICADDGWTSNVKLYSIALVILGSKFMEIANALVFMEIVKLRYFLYWAQLL